MSIDNIDRANIESNAGALNTTLSYGVLDLFGAGEKQANKIFRNLDQLEQRGGNDLQQAIKEYRSLFDRFNKADKADMLPDLQLVDYDNDGDMDIQLVKAGKIVRTFKHRI